MDAVTALAQLGGTATYRDLLRLITRRTIRTAVANGAIDRAGRNAYCLRLASADVDVARSQGATLAGLSAALHHGWSVRFAPDQTCLTHRVPHGERSGWATTPLRTVQDCASQLPFADALSVADSALRSHALTHADLVAASRRWPAAARRVAKIADGRAENPFESSLRALAIEAGLSVVAQWEVRTQGLVLHPDVADPLRGIALEADSYAHHGATRADHERDCERYNALVVSGWRVLRFTWTDVMFNQQRVIGTIRAMSPADDGPTRGDLGVAGAAA